MKHNLLLMLSKECLNCKYFDIYYDSNTIYKDDNVTFAQGTIECKHKEVCKYFKNDKTLSRAIAREDIKVFL